MICIYPSSATYSLNQRRFRTQLLEPRVIEYPHSSSFKECDKVSSTCIQILDCLDIGLSGPSSVSGIGSAPHFAITIPFQIEEEEDTRDYNAPYVPLSKSLEDGHGAEESNKDENHNSDDDDNSNHKEVGEERDIEKLEEEE
jgi:hypothetical protein